MKIERRTLEMWFYMKLPTRFGISQCIHFPLANPNRVAIWDFKCHLIRACCRFIVITRSVRRSHVRLRARYGSGLITEVRVRNAALRTLEKSPGIRCKICMWTCTHVAHLLVLRLRLAAFSSCIISDNGRSSLSPSPSPWMSLMGGEPNVDPNVESRVDTATCPLPTN